MASKYLPRRKKFFYKTSMLLYQQKLIEQHYNFFRCRIENNVLICEGVVESKNFKNKYKVQIRCVYGSEPYSKILEPDDIKPCKEIHMYEDHSLCLHYPRDMKWTAQTFIYQYTVPWVIEWIVYYELFLVNGGVWKGPESPTHFSEEDKNLSEETSYD